MIAVSLDSVFSLVLFLSTNKDSFYNMNYNVSCSIHIKSLFLFVFLTGFLIYCFFPLLEFAICCLTDLTQGQMESERNISLNDLYEIKHLTRKTLNMHHYLYNFAHYISHTHVHRLLWYTFDQLILRSKCGLGRLIQTFLYFKHDY